MLRKSRHLLCAALVMVLLMSLAPMTALAVSADVPEVSMPAAEGTADASHVEAVIGDAAVSFDAAAEDAQIAEDLAPGDFLDRELYPSDFLSIEYATNQLTEAIKLRKEEIYIYLRSDSMLEDITLDVMFLAASGALINTYGGDYLLCSLYDYGYYAEYIEDGGMYYYIIGYAVMYSTTAEQEQELAAKIQELQPTVLGDAVNDYQKIKAIHDYIINNVEYDMENTENAEDPLPHTAYAALMQGKATAQGYVMLFDMMARMYVISSNIIVGTVEGQTFLWNIVRCDDAWYNMNIVANDLDSTGAYFMKGSNDFPDNHVPAEAYLTEEYVQGHPMAENAYVPEKAMSGKAGANAEWYYNAVTNALHVSGIGRMDDEVQIPNIYGFNPDVVIEEGITYIGKNAFNSMSINAVQLPDSLTEIGAYAFVNSEVKEINGVNHVKVIGEGAFQGCIGLGNYQLPEGVESVGALAFYGVPVAKAELPRSVKTISGNAFGHESFEGYVVGADHPYLCTENGVLYNKDKTALLGTAMVMDGDFVLPDTVTVIGEGAFYGSTWCTSMILPEGVTRLGKDAFRNSGLVVIQLPSTLTEIPEGAFATDSLNGILIPDSIVSIGANAFACNYLYGVQYTGSLEQWNKIAIAEENIGLDMAQISENSNIINTYNWTLNLTTGEFAAESTADPNWGPWKDKIVSVELHSYVRNVPKGAFSDCTNLKTINIKIRDLQVDKDAFAGCTALTDVYYCETEGTWEKNGLHKAFAAFPNVSYHFKEIASSGPVGDNLQWSFDDFTQTLTISGQGPMCDFAEYELRPWYEWFNQYSEINVVIEEGVTSVGAYAFMNCYTLLNVQFPSTLERICTKAFFDCDLGPLVLNDGLKYIDEMAFSACESEGYYDAEANKWYVSLVLPETVTDIGRRAFFGPTWRDVYIPVSVKNIGEYMISGSNYDTKLHYGGTKAQWKQVTVHADNSDWLKTPAVYSAGCPHVVVQRDRVDATCTEVGYTEGAYCGVCGVVLKEQQVVDKLPHTYENDVCTVCGGEKPPESPFTDVMYTDWFFNPVLWAVDANVTGGIGNGQFGPNNFCTRAQVVTFLYAAAGKPEVTTTDNPFEDVADDAWYAKPVLWAVENGITSGIDATHFGPDVTCTRAQVVTFLYAAAGKPEITASSTFTDVADTDWYAKPVIWAKENDVTGGISATEFGPNQTCTRAQVVTFLYKVYGNK